MANDVIAGGRAKRTLSTSPARTFPNKQFPELQYKSWSHYLFINSATPTSDRKARGENYSILRYPQRVFRSTWAAFNRQMCMHTCIHECIHAFMNAYTQTDRLKDRGTPKDTSARASQTEANAQTQASHAPRQSFFHPSFEKEGCRWQSSWSVVGICYGCT